MTSAVAARTERATAFSTALSTMDGRKYPSPTKANVWDTQSCASLEERRRPELP
jgi:hypothetical protein